jgi:hypothetical protein
MEMMENRSNCSMKNVNDIYKINIIETHADVIVRLLFIYSTFFQDLSYVQGMNEIIAPIYYVFSFDKTYGVESSIDNIEADTFWTFNCLMTQIKDTFNREKDGEDIGLSGKVKRLKSMLEIVDPQLYSHFERYKLEFSNFAYRWFILFFSQDFLMIDILRLWDYMFAPEDKFENCYFISLAILLIKKDELLVSDLTGILSNLKVLKGINIEEIIGISKKIKTEFGKQCLKIIGDNYE